MFFFLAITSGSIRLQDGKPSTGRVEIFYNNQWGTVCDDAWDMNGAKVVCRQFGALHASQAFSGAYYGQGSCRIWMDEVACSRSESHIYDCRHCGRETMIALTAEMPVFSVFQFVWQVEELTTAKLKFSTKESGAQCVIMTGISMMPTWCFVSLVSPTHLLLLAVDNTVRVPILSGWMMSIVAEERLRCLIALVFILDGE